MGLFQYVQSGYESVDNRLKYKRPRYTQEMKMSNCRAMKLTLKRVYDNVYLINCACATFSEVAGLQLVFGILGSDQTHR